MHANAIANGVVGSFHFLLPISLPSIAHGQNIQGYLAFTCLSSPVTLRQP